MMLPSVLARRVVLAAHGLLILGVVLRHPSALSVVIAALLLPPLPGLIRGRSYTYAWASMLVAFFVAGYLADGYARPDTRWSAFLIGSIAAIDYVALMMFVRFTARERAVAEAQAPAEQTAESDGASR
jgi:uncharacterized membrane protein